MNRDKIVIDERMHEHKLGCGMKRISWSAIFAGALVGIGLSFLLNLFSVAIGLSAFIPNSTEGSTTLAIGGFISLVIGVIVSMFVAGYTAGYLGRPYCAPRNLGVVYGFTAWCIALLLMVMFAAHIGRYVTAYSNFISNPNYIVTTMDRNSNMTTTATTPAATATSTSDAVVVDVNTQKAASGIVMGAFIIFVLFFIGALSSCLGGYCGMCTCKRETCE